MSSLLRLAFRAVVMLPLLLLLAPTGASAAVVISQVYGGGGNAGSVFTNDYIELFNNGAAPVTVTGWTVQYASATGTSWTATPLTGTIAPGAYYLVQEAVGAGGTTPLPTPQATGAIAMSGTAGKVALVNNATALAGSGCPIVVSVVDFVGYGATANCFEGAGPTPPPSNSNAVFRAANGCTDNNVNSADFTAALAAPRNASSPANLCGGPPVLTLNINDVTVAEGNAGTVVATFTVTLSAPAGAGGVTFDIATANNTATIADNDYVARALIGQTIPAGG
ncbi:MAG: lamin tail domain-containing protein, partial [Lysobacterales bacterium]